MDKVDGHYLFIVLSFVIRIVEAMGNAAFLTASFAIIAMEFPDNVATTFVKKKKKNDKTIGLTVRVVINRFLL